MRLPSCAVQLVAYHCLLHMSCEQCHLRYSRAHPVVEPPHCNDRSLYVCHTVLSKLEEQHVALCNQVFIACSVHSTLHMQAHITTLENGSENQQALTLGLQYLVSISYVDNDEVLKICLDYWNLLVPDVYTTSQTTDVNAGFSFGTTLNQVHTPF